MVEQPGKLRKRSLYEHSYDVNPKTSENSRGFLDVRPSGDQGQPTCDELPEEVVGEGLHLFAAAGGPAADEVAESGLGPRVDVADDGVEVVLE